MAKKYIDVVIKLEDDAEGKAGEVTRDAKGFRGKSCAKAADVFTKALAGDVLKMKRTADFNKKPPPKHVIINN